MLPIPQQLSDSPAYQSSGRKHSMERPFERKQSREGHPGRRQTVGCQPQETDINSVASSVASSVFLPPKQSDKKQKQKEGKTAQTKSNGTLNSGHCFVTRNGHENFQHSKLHFPSPPLKGLKEGMVRKTSLPTIQSTQSNCQSTPGRGASQKKTKRRRKTIATAPTEDHKQMQQQQRPKKGKPILRRKSQIDMINTCSPEMVQLVQKLEDQLQVIDDNGDYGDYGFDDEDIDEIIPSLTPEPELFQSWRSLGPVAGNVHRLPLPPIGAPENGAEPVTYEAKYCWCTRCQMMYRLYRENSGTLNLWGDYPCHKW